MFCRTEQHGVSVVPLLPLSTNILDSNPVCKACLQILQIPTYSLKTCVGFIIINL